MKEQKEALVALRTNMDEKLDNLVSMVEKLAPSKEEIKVENSNKNEE
jgi:hypothetical protein